MQLQARFKPLAWGVTLVVPLAVVGVNRAGAEQFPPGQVVTDAAQSALQVKHANGVAYVSGGAGSEEADALNRMSGDFNLKLTMTIPSGQFTSPSSLRIEDQHGKTVMDVRPDGPIFLAKLPGGKYVIQATAEGQTMTRKVTVPARGLEAVAFTWPAAEPPSRAGDAPDVQR